jgi:hypothetical protein
VIIDDIQELPDEMNEVCVVGSGPVGLALALQLDELGIQTVVLESGGPSPRESAESSPDAEIANSAVHAPMNLAVCRAFGGTSWAWGGRCVPLDPIDFKNRDYVPEGRWPIDERNVNPWYTPANKFLQCGPPKFSMPCPAFHANAATISSDTLERWAIQPRLGPVYWERIVSSSRLTLCLNSTVTNLESSTGEIVTGASVWTPNGRRLIRAKKFILALGGIETTRLLLACQRYLPQAFGGPDGALGRYYMGHVSGKIATMVLAKPSNAKELDFIKDNLDGFVRRRFTLPADVQIDNQLLNSSFWIDNPPFHDSEHKNGTLSAIFLALAFAPLGRKLLPEAIRLAHIGIPPFQITKHVSNVLMTLPSMGKNLVGILRDRFVANPRKPGFLVPNGTGRYALHYHAEQAPNPLSRITLSKETDRFGLPRVKIDLRYTDQDISSVVRSHVVLDAALRTSGIGRLEYSFPKEQLAERVWAQASDGFHQIGTTRMGKDPRQSIVDPELRVHGLRNLFIASSSVFPTSGQANSTLPAVALAIRLATSLANSLRKHECSSFSSVH